MTKTALLPGRLFTGESFVHGTAVLTEGDRVVGLVPEGEVPSGYTVRRYAEDTIAPGLIDFQVYGAGGLLFSAHPRPEALRMLADEGRKCGTLLCQPTLATNSMDVFLAAMDALRAYRAEGGQGIHGLHLEGPWINPAKRGAHLTEYIHPPTEAEVDRVLKAGEGLVTTITLAPEVCDPQLVRRISEAGIVVSAGHSNATYAEAVAAFGSGIRTVTHLYNAMSALGHRAPGLVGATMTTEGVCASIIADGEHVDFAAIRIAKAAMGERLFVITDAVTETDSGPYRHRLNENRYECDGTLSGSAVSMAGSVRNLVKEAGIGEGEALRMASLYPARILGIDHRYGRIAAGAAAEFLLFGKRAETDRIINGRELGN